MVIKRCKTLIELNNLFVISKGKSKMNFELKTKNHVFTKTKSKRQISTNKQKKKQRNNEQKCKFCISFERRVSVRIQSAS